MNGTGKVVRSGACVVLMSLLLAAGTGCSQSSLPRVPGVSGNDQKALSNEVSVDIGQNLSIKMVLIPAGVFSMGGFRGRSDEQPVHEVKISQPFYLSATEITSDQATVVFGKAPSSKFQGPGRPVDSVSWFDAVRFCNALSEQQKLENCYLIEGTSVTCNFQASGFRLPTEAEWEYACRGGATTTYSWGDTFQEENAWCLSRIPPPFNPPTATYAFPMDQSQPGLSQEPSGSVHPSSVHSGSYALSGQPTPPTVTPATLSMSLSREDSIAALQESHPVGLKHPNPWGLFDMVGNMMEWCQDWYGPYSAAPATDPTGPATGTYRTLRGGGWMTLPEFALPSSRDWVKPDASFEGYGFRVCRRAKSR